MMLQKVINFLQECQRNYPKMVSFDYAQRESLISALEIDQAYITRLEAAYLIEKVARLRLCDSGKVPLVMVRSIKHD